MQNQSIVLLVLLSLNSVSESQLKITCLGWVGMIQQLFERLTIETENDIDSQ